MSNKEKATKISWLTLAFMAFSTVWGFGNITNGFVYFNGPQVIFSWIFMFALYFIPYALMVGELGSAFKNEGGGVSSWLHQTTNAKLAYYAGWTYWACHITYIASKGSGFLKALSWAVFRNAETYDSFPTRYIQLATFFILLLGCYIASLGLNPLKKLLTAAGTCTFVMSLLYIVMMFAAPAINPTAEYVHANLSFSSMIPNFNVTYFTSLSILVFAVGGCEKISPYVNKVENPSKGFPRGMIALAVMVVACRRSAPADQAELCVYAHALPVGVCRLHRPAQCLRYHPRRVPLCQKSGRGQVLRRLVLCRYRRVLRAGYV